MLGLFLGGVECLPAALLDADLADALGARHAGVVPAPGLRRRAGPGDRAAPPDRVPAVDSGVSG